jgi:hypothetical protein
MRTLLLAGLLSACLLAECGGGTAPKTAAPLPPSATQQTSSESSSASPETVQPEIHCADVRGVFVAHGTDGRGDCEPADPRRNLGESNP